MINPEVAVYCIQSTIHTDRFYIGSSYRLRRRFGDHKRELINGKHKNVKLKNHVNKYGLDDLDFFVLKYCDQEYLLQEEQFFVDILNPFFNVAKIVDRINSGDVTDERRQRISESSKNNWNDPEIRSKTINSIKKIWEDKEYKDKMRNVLHERWKQPGFKERFRQSTVGAKRSEEAKANMSKCQKGKKFSEKAKMNIVMTKKITGESKYVGVYRRKANNKWMSNITVDGKYIAIPSCFSTEIEAAIAREHYIVVNGIVKQRLNNVSSSGE